MQPCATAAKHADPNDLPRLPLGGDWRRPDNREDEDDGEQNVLAGWVDHS